MARAVSLTTLLDYVRKRADIESEIARFPDAELTAYINQSITELYDILVGADEDYYLTTQTITTTPNVAISTLQADFYKLIAVDLNIGGQLLTLKPFVLAERNLYQAGSAWDINCIPSYRLTGPAISWRPVPTGAYNISLWYIPTPTPLVAGGDTFDGVNGWEELVVTDVAIKVGIKNQIDAADMQVLMQRKGELVQRIESMKDRDRGGPQRIQDTLGVNSREWWP